MEKSFKRPNRASRPWRLVAAGSALWWTFGDAVDVDLDPYVLQHKYVGKDFFSQFRFFDGEDPTQGAVAYVDGMTASQTGLIDADDSHVYMGADFSHITAKRPSVRVESKETFNSGLFIATIPHIPTGCGTWPAFWMFGEDHSHVWPRWGEYDIIEGVHKTGRSSTTLHTRENCDQEPVDSGKDFLGSWNPGVTAQIHADNCYVSAEGQWGNQGCSQLGPKDSMGADYNAKEGGTWAAEWDPQAERIRTWFWPAGTEPADIQSGTPKPHTWGKPFSFFSLKSSVCSTRHFKNMRLVFDITFCGDLGNALWGAGCPAEAATQTCPAFVQNNPKELSEAYWVITRLDTYKRSDAPAQPQATPAPAGEPVIVGHEPSPSPSPVPTPSPTPPNGEDGGVDGFLGSQGGGSGTPSPSPSPASGGSGSSQEAKSGVGPGTVFLGCLVAGGATAFAILSWRGVGVEERPTSHPARTAMTQHLAFSLCDNDEEEDEDEDDDDDESGAQSRPAKSEAGRSEAPNVEPDEPAPQPFSTAGKAQQRELQMMSEGPALDYKSLAFGGASGPSTAPVLGALGRVMPSDGVMFPLGLQRSNSDGSPSRHQGSPQLPNLSSQAYSRSPNGSLAGRPQTHASSPQRAYQPGSPQSNIPAGSAAFSSAAGFGQYQAPNTFPQLGGLPSAALGGLGMGVCGMANSPGGHSHTAGLSPIGGGSPSAAAPQLYNTTQHTYGGEAATNSLNAFAQSAAAARQNQTWAHSLPVPPGHLQPPAGLQQQVGLLSQTQQPLQFR